MSASDGEGQVQGSPSGEEERRASSIRRVVAASVIGTAVEYYDFTLYATASALVFNQLFFPEFDPLVGTISAFGTFFAGYVARPFGGILFGHFGDKIGRKAMMLLTILIMGLATVFIGLMPTYQQIGVWAPILLVALRLMQGIGLGGEYGAGVTMTVEHAPWRRRGFFGSIVHIGVPAGFLTPVVFLSLLVFWLPEEQFLAWGWRLPFLFSIVLVGLGLYIRLRIHESPTFREFREESAQVSSIPVVEVLRTRWKQVLLAIGAKVAESGPFNIYAVFVVAYATTELGLPEQTVLNGVLVAAAVMCLTLPLFGALSDRIGRRPVYLLGAASQVLLAFPFFLLVNTGQTALVWLAIVLGLAIGTGAIYGAQAAFFSELFPTRVRYSGLSLVQQIGAIFGGGLSPLLATSLLALLGGAPWGVSGYLIAVGVLSGLCALLLGETIGIRLSEKVPEKELLTRK